ncbi:MAG: Spy/CpxP family protein refolding chaperone [Myxococcota bacterium]
MHPGFYYRWKRAQERHEDEARASCGGWGRRGRRRDRESGRSGYWASGGAFGVRRPLRFMAHRLDLDDDQVAELAAILNHLKTERAQAAVDEQRSVNGVAEAIAGDAFDADKASEALEMRVESARRLKAEIEKALSRTHAMLDKEQRERLAYLLRSGQLSI